MSFPTNFIDEVPQAHYYFCRNDGCDFEPDVCIDEQQIGSRH
jgi:hypothetical protein